MNRLHIPVIPYRCVIFTFLSIMNWCKDFLHKVYLTNNATQRILMYIRPITALWPPYSDHDSWSVHLSASACPQMFLISFLSSWPSLAHIRQPQYLWVRSEMTSPKIKLSHSRYIAKVLSITNLSLWHNLVYTSIKSVNV